MEQRAEVEGSHNITVQIVGENNRVTVAGAAALRLTMFPRRRKEGGDIGLLSAYTQSIDLVGREPEMAELRAWLATERDIAIQVRTGKAGTGKTRLAFDVCDKLLNESKAAATEAEKWQAGFVNGDQLANLTRNAGARWGWERPTLAVVDYAAERTEALYRWFGQLADFAPTDGPPLRILLMERKADAESGWLQTALGSGVSAARAIRAMLDPEKPVELPGLVLPEHRHAVLDGVFAKLDSPIRAPAMGADPDFDQRLAEATFGGEPLFLMMAALLAAETSLPQVLALPRTEIAHEVAKREIGRVRRLANERGLDPSFLAHMVAYVTLCQGSTWGPLLDAVETEARELKRGLAKGAAAVAEALTDALPGSGAAPEPIRPDALGEAVVLQTLGNPRADGPSVVLRAFGQLGAPVAAFVIRTAQDFAGAGYEQPLAWLDALIEGGAVDTDQLWLIADELPGPSRSQSSLALARHSVRIFDRIANMLAEETKQGRAERIPGLALAYNNLALSLSEVGQREAALAPAKKAAELYRDLAARAPHAYQPALAMALNTLANRLSEVGQREAALATAQEAVAIRRELAAKAPDAYRPALAMALNNLAIRLSEVGRREAALAPAEEAVAIRRELAAKAPDAYRPDLAGALNNLATFLSPAGRREAALAPAKEAADLYRELAAKAPDAYRPDLAGALNNLSNCLSEVGQREAALAPAEEAVAIRRELAAKAPDVYRPDLASALHNLANRLSEVGQREAALAPAREAADICRELAAKAADAYRPDLASALHNLSNCLSAAGRREAALAPAQEAAELYRELAAKTPDAYRPDLAVSLMAFANCLDAAEAPEKAIEQNAEAIRVYTPAFLALPAAFARDAGRMCQDYLVRCEKLGREPDLELLRPIVEMLQQMQEPAADEAGQ
jgi:tetratricopeptide (TPR) repeat protein